jgi:hypothetical protein
VRGVGFRQTITEAVKRSNEQGGWITAVVMSDGTDQQVIDKAHEILVRYTHSDFDNVRLVIGDGPREVHVVYEGAPWLRIQDASGGTKMDAATAKTIGEIIEEKLRYKHSGPKR